MREIIFKFRGWLFIPAGIILLLLAKPTLGSLLAGFLVTFFVGEAIRIWAVGYSGVTTRSDKLEVPVLITAGPYAYIRNPLYLGNLISWLGFSIASSGGASLIARIVMFGAVILSYLIIYGNIIPLEEAFLLKEFGESFREYLSGVPRMFPSLKPYGKQVGKWFPSVILKAESQTILMLLAVSALLILKYLNIITFSVSI